MGAEFTVWKHRSVLSFIVLGVVICRTHFGSAVPVQNEEPLTKMYPRGSHWAVGHLMGKKSIGLPFGYEDDDKIIYSSAPEEVKQLEGYLQWSEFVKNLIRLLDANDSRNAQLLREEILFNRKKQWEAADTTTKNNNLKEMTDYLLQILNMKDNNPS
ncbi:gastrin-releasing peptide-like [Huso huso]|uniref:Gastrin-releasing peptide n=1 Tax=Huso huso TaxID=61971 RepID=A0ABR1A767_HUSHU